MPCYEDLQPKVSSIDSRSKSILNNLSWLQNKELQAEPLKWTFTTLNEKCTMPGEFKPYTLKMNFHDSNQRFMRTTKLAHFVIEIDPHDFERLLNSTFVTFEKFRGQFQEFSKILKFKDKIYISRTVDTLQYNLSKKS